MQAFFNPDVGQAESDAVAQVMSEGALSTGEYVREFEEEFASYCNVDDAVAVSSGSVALELALRVSDLSSGDRVIVSPFNCSAVLYAILRADLRPYFIDIDASTLNLNPGAVRDAVRSEPAIAGLLLTPTYGLPEDQEVVEIATDHGLTVINDFCQAIGATVDDQLSASAGDLGVASFGATKNITTGEGGIVVSDSTELIKEVRRRRSNDGIDLDIAPTNARMSDIEAVIGLKQLHRYPELLERRRAAGSAYLEGIPETVTPQPSPQSVGHAYHRFAIRTPDRSELRDHLTAAGIETRPGITKPLSSYQLVSGSAPDSELPNTEQAVSDVLLLPMHSNLEPATANRIASVVEEFYS